MKCESISNLYFIVPEKPQTDICTPAPLIHSLGEKTVMEKMTYTVLHYPQSPLSSLRISLNFLVRYIFRS